MATQLLVLLRLIAFGLASLLGFSNTPVQNQVRVVQVHDAWDSLRPCAETTSLDGNWSMVLQENGKAEVTNHKDDTKLSGNWELVDARDHVFRIDLLAFSNDFTVVPSATGCVLASGSLKRADLSQSWFTRRKHDSGDLIAAANSIHVTTK
jgi:hypothetical protein